MPLHEKNDFRLSNAQWLRLLLVLAAALFLGLGSLALFGIFARILAAVFIALSIAAALAPLVERLSKQMPRGVAIVIVYLVLTLLVISLFAVILPSLIVQGENLLDRLPDIFDRIERVVEGQSWLSTDSLFDTAVAQIQNFGTTLIRFPVELFDAILDVILVIVISLYMLFEADSARRFGLSLFPGTQRRFIWDVAADMLDSMGGFVRGLVFNIIIIGVMSYIGLSIIGVEYALALAIFAGFMEIIPVAGSIIASIPAIGIALLQSPTTALITAIFFLVIQQFEGNILTPNVMHSQARVPPLLVLIAVFAGASVGGVVGALVAVPLVAAIRVFVIRVIAPAIRSGNAQVESSAPPLEP